MNSPDGSIVFRAPRSLWLANALAFAFFLVMALVSMTMDLDLWLRLAFGAFTLLGVAAFVELATRRVEVDAEGLTLVSNFRRRTIRRSEIRSATWAKGSSVALKLRDGTWVSLPGVGRSTQGLTNSIRAWLRRTEEKDSPGDTTLES